MIRLLWFSLLGSWLLAAAAAAQVPLSPQDFASGLELRLEGSDGLYRLSLPAEVYRGVVRADLADLRVFNAAAEQVPFQLQRPATPAAESWRNLPLFPLPAAAGSEDSALRLRIERDAGGAVLQVEAERTGTAATPNAYLLDASALPQAMTALEVDWEEQMENGGSHRVQLEGSDDLQQWRLLVTEATLLQLQYRGEHLSRRRLDLPATRFRYLRLSTATGSPPWQVTAVRALLASGTAEPERQWLHLPGSASAGNRLEFLFDSGGHFPVDRLQLQLPQPNTLVQVSLHSRERETGPWQQRAGGLAYRLNREGTTLVSPDLVTPVCADRYWLLRLERGELGQGSPELGLGWQPHQLTFVARGAGPFLLAYGSGRVITAADGALLAQLTAQSRSKMPALPAHIGEQRSLGGPAARDARPPFAWSTWLLWGTLLLGVVLLAAMAWRLYRQLQGEQVK